jgi:hypothetical protein
MYIICAIITIPIGILGYFVLPGTPDKPNKIILSEKDITLSKTRLSRSGHATSSDPFTLSTLKSLLTNKAVWALLALDIFFWNGSINTSSGGYLLWLKSLNRFSTSRINELAAISPALGIFYTLFVCFASDLVLGPAWAITLAHVWNVIGLVILVVWDVRESALWFAFVTTYSAVAMSSVLYGWVNTLLRYSATQRAVALVVLNTVAQSTTAWTPLLVFKTVEGPRFTKGYAFVLVNAVCLILLAHGIGAWTRRFVALFFFFLVVVFSFFLSFSFSLGVLGLDCANLVFLGDSRLGVRMRRGVRLLGLRLRVGNCSAVGTSRWVGGYMVMEIL